MALYLMRPANTRRTNWPTHMSVGTLRSTIGGEGDRADRTMRSLILVMGVSGSGKTSVGRLLARRFGVAFADADDLHPQSNLDKMAHGEALSDADRWPWLLRVGEVLAEAAALDSGLVIACSALKREYREVILRSAPATRFVYLAGSPALISTRLSDRRDHFMPTSLLASQLEALEPLAPDEPGVTVGIEHSVDLVAESAAIQLDAVCGRGVATCA